MTDNSADTTPHSGVATMEQRKSTHPTPPETIGGPPPRRGYLLPVAGGIVLLLLAAFVGLLMGGVFDGASGELTDDEIARLKAESGNSNGAVKRNQISADVAVRGGAVGASAALQDGSGDSSGNSTTVEQAAAQRDARLRSALVGEWELPKDGVYRLDFRADNTGTMVYRPSGLNKAALFTSRLEISIEWTLKDGHVDVISVSGKPAYAFKVAIASRGKRKYYRIDEITDDKLVLHELQKRKTEQWTRVP